MNSTTIDNGIESTTSTTVLSVMGILLNNSSIDVPNAVQQLQKDITDEVVDRIKDDQLIKIFALTILGIVVAIFLIVFFIAIMTNRKKYFGNNAGIKRKFIDGVNLTKGVLNPGLRGYKLVPTSDNNERVSFNTT